jgi:TonB family protein
MLPHSLTSFIRTGWRSLIMLCLTLLALPAFAQTTPETADISVQPIFVTVRIFQLKAKRGSYEGLNEQVFQIRSASLNTHEDWLKQLQKTYPGFEIALLRTEAKRVFRTSKPAIIALATQADGRYLELQIVGAQSYGDGVKPGTTIVPEISLRFSGSQETNKPLTFSLNPLEVSSGMTYFFSPPNLKFNPTDYVKFVRPNAPATNFDGQDIFLLFAFSVEMDKATTPARLFNDRQSTQLQEGATKKVQPEIPETLRQAGLNGQVRVQVEISPAGKVTSANVYSSSFPEINAAVLTAARQWEFPTSLFAEDNKSITGFLTFNFPPAPPSAGKQ